MNGPFFPWRLLTWHVWIYDKIWLLPTKNYLFALFSVKKKPLMGFRTEKFGPPVPKYPGFLLLQRLPRGKWYSWNVYEWAWNMYEFFQKPGCYITHLQRGFPGSYWFMQDLPFLWSLILNFQRTCIVLICSPAFKQLEKASNLRRHTALWILDSQVITLVNPVELQDVRPAPNQRAHQEAQFGSGEGPGIINWRSSS
jgi:hypothetical protein